jgi:AcrR family transcriptional regulator
VPRKPATLPRKRPRQKRAQLTVEALVQAVEIILARDGVDGLTAAKIAEVAGVSVGSLYQYFPGKESIFAALAERYMEQFFDGFARTLDACRDTPMETLVEAMLRALLSVHAVQARIQPLLYDAMPSLGLTPRMLELLDRYSAELARFLEARGTVDDPQAAAWVIIHSMEGIVRRYGMSPPPEPERERYFRALVRLLVGFVSHR